MSFDTSTMDEKLLEALQGDGQGELTVQQMVNSSKSGPDKTLAVIENIPPQKRPAHFIYLVSKLSLTYQDAAEQGYELLCEFGDEAVNQIRGDICWGHMRTDKTVMLGINALGKIGTTKAIDALTEVSGTNNELSQAVLEALLDLRERKMEEGNNSDMEALDIAVKRVSWFATRPKEIESALASHKTEGLSAILNRAATAVLGAGFATETLNRHLTQRSVDEVIFQQLFANIPG